MDRNSELRQKVRLLKALGQINAYVELAEIIGIKSKSFYNWLRGEYNLSEDKEILLREIVGDLWIPIN